MIEEGLYTKFSIDEVYGMHNIHCMEIGTFGTRKGGITTSENLFEISISGKGRARSFTTYDKRYYYHW